MKISLLAAASLAAFAIAAPASAAVIDLATLVGVWDIQDQDGVLGLFYDNSYVASTATTAKFTDLYVWGDEYEVYINGVLQYAALAPADIGAFEINPDVAYASGNFTRGLVALNAGDVLSFKAITIPSGYTDGTIAVTNAVPEPATWAMMIAGFGLVGFAARRRTAATA